MGRDPICSAIAEAARVEQVVARANKCVDFCRDITIPEDGVTLADVLEQLTDALAGIDRLDSGHWNEHTGELTLDEDDWGAIDRSRHEARAILAALPKATEGGADES